MDGLFYEFQAGGGIGRLFAEVLPRACALEPDLHVTMLTTGRLRGPLPVHPRIGTEKLGRAADYARLFSPGRLPWGRFPARVRAGALDRAAHRLGGDLWHSTYYTRPPSWRGPSLVIVYDLIHERYPELFPLDRDFLPQKERAIREATHVACISESARRDVLERYGLPEERTSVLYLAGGVSPSEAPARREPKPYLLYVGMRLAYKNFGGLLEAFAGWEHAVEFDLLCAGGPQDWSRDEASQLAKLGLAGRVRHVGRVTDAELAALYRGAACFVYPSLYEGFGLPVLEAYACNTPVALSRTSSLPEVGGDHGFYFDPREPADLRRALSEAVGQAAQPRAARAAAAKAWAATFTWDRTARETIALYRALYRRLA